LVAIVFQKSNSSTATYIRDSVIKSSTLPANVYALQTHQEVLDYVRKNSGAIGVLALNWLSDENDPKVVDLLKGLRVVAVSSSIDNTEFYKPTFNHLRRGLYPFLRGLYIVNGEGRTGLGTGFASYLASDPGMTLIERFGLLPAKAPVREIETRKSFE
jgi:phosphate transport system substrate-binding protein